jgi:TIR domain-containing protein
MRIFISYAREDAEHADRLFRGLSEMEELNPWLDRQHLLPGTKWKDEILTAIEDSRFVALILSTQSVSKTGFVQKEFQAAIDRLSYYPPGSIFLVPVRVEPCAPKHRELNELQYVDMFPDWEEGLAKIRKAIISQIDVDLGTILRELKDCQHSQFTRQEKWVETYGERVLAYGAPSLIRAIDNANDHYDAELFCLRVMAEIAKKANSSLLFDFVIRMHDITKLCQYDHEMPSFYGTLLYGASLLGDTARALLLRAAVDFWKEHTSGYNKGSWWSDLAFRDLLKHFVAAETSTYVSGQTMSRVPHFSKADLGRLVLDDCFPLMSWDVARADFITFFARRTGRFLLLPDVVNHLLSSFGRDNYGADPSRNWRPDVPTMETRDAILASRDRFHHELTVADYKEDHHRFGILFRIAEYLRYVKEDSYIVGYAEQLNAACMKVLAIRNEQVATLLAGLSDRERRRLFWLIERQAHVDLAEMLRGHDTKDCEFLLEFVPWTTGYRRSEADKKLPITLSKSAVPLDFPGGSNEQGT